MFKLLLLLLAQLLQSTSSVSTDTCPTHCICHLEFKFATCTSANLTKLPPTIPPCTEHLDLSFNHLDFIQHRAFQNVRRLNTLLLNDNRISALASGAFLPLEFLLKLDLSHNNITILNKGFSSGLFSLRELYLVQNQLLMVNNECFLHLDSIRKLDLRQNNISSIQVRAFSSLSTLRRVFLDNNQISSLENRVFSMLRNLEELGLSGNLIEHLGVGVLSPLTSLALLNLADNQLTQIDFKSFLSLHTRSTHIRLDGNPWTCDCDLQRVFRKLHSVHRLLLDDYDNLTCTKPEELRGSALLDVDSKLCFAETVTVLMITVTVLITVVAAIIMAEKNRKHTNKGKHWTEVSEVSFDSQKSF
ncbi:leucine-rich repeat-containing protein 3B [Trichomycterus rosablanca]|uniref:leucine-rich repeat-containing protein 3B n=1 Tax=Trichomycterus rosablanca TaxID=2290929 RepID=UPI002F360975